VKLLRLAEKWKAIKSIPVWQQNNLPYEQSLFF